MAKWPNHFIYGKQFQKRPNDNPDHHHSVEENEDEAKQIWCQFHQHFYVQMFRTNVVSALFTTYMQLEKAAKTTFVQKICR